MRKLLRWALAALIVMACGAPAMGQDVHMFWQVAPSSGFNQWAPVSSTNPLPVSASASISGFAPGATGTPISVTTGGVTGTLPAGAVVVAFNVGTTNIAYCRLGGSATTSDIPLAPSGGWFAFTVGAATQLTCITSTSTTTVNMIGGTGLATGSGGGSGGGGSVGNITEWNSVALGSPTAWGAVPSGNVIGANVNIAAGLNANGQATMANSAPVAIARNQSTLPVAPTPYPATATPYTASATGTTGATTATLAGASSVTTYICGFSIRANATAAATGNATVTGTITGTLNFTQWTAPNASGIGIAEMIFAPCIPASATNTSIAVVSAAPGSGGVVSVTAWGYKL